MNRSDCSLSLSLGLGFGFDFGGSAAFAPPLVSRSIGEALSDDTTQRPFGTVQIVHTKSNAVRVAKIELTQISVQMLLSANAGRRLSCRA
jgi:hypothetical protein